MRTKALVKSYRKMLTSPEEFDTPRVPDGLEEFLESLEETISQLDLNSLPAISVSDDGALSLFVDEGSTALEMDVFTPSEAYCNVMMLDPNTNRYIHFEVTPSEFSPISIALLLNVLPQLKLEKKPLKQSQLEEVRVHERMVEVSQKLAELAPASVWSIPDRVAA